MIPKLFILNDAADKKYEAQLSKHLFLAEKIKPVIQVRRDRDILAATDTAAAQEAEVKAAVRAALIRQFSIKQRALGQVLHRGELYAVVEAVQGVENSDVVMQVPSVDG